MIPTLSHAEKPQKGARRIVVDDQVYWYSIGRSNVPIWLPDGSKRVFKLTEVAGRDYDVLERGQWKKTPDGMITPADVATFIRNNLC